MRAEQFRNFFYEVSKGRGNVKNIRVILRRLWGWRWTETAIYQQFLMIDGRENVFERYIKFMWAIEEDDFKNFELIRHLIDAVLDSKVEGFPSLQTSISQLVAQIEVELGQIKKLATA